MISQAEYLRTHFEHPEPDYIDGELVEWPVPNAFHGRTRIRLSDAFRPWEVQRQLFRISGIRLRIAPERFRVVDFAIFASAQSEPIPSDPPYAIVEIVSPDDTYQALMRKFADCEQAGVDFVFVAQPSARKLSRYRDGSLFTVAALELPAYQLKIPADSLFD